MRTIRSGVFREGEFTVNQWGVKMKNVLLDTGALQASYVNKELVEKNSEEWKSSIKPLISIVKATEKMTERISFLNNSREEISGIVQVIVWTMPDLDFISGLPDVLKNFLPTIVEMLNDTQKSVSTMQVETIETIE